MTQALHTPSLIDAFHQGMQEADEDWNALPQRLRGRGIWLKERGRIKDCELMFDAATEIENLRGQVFWFASRQDMSKDARDCEQGCNGCENCTEYDETGSAT